MVVSMATKNWWQLAELDSKMHGELKSFIPKPLQHMLMGELQELVNRLHGSNLP
jgi:hypothetical protein